MKKSVITDDLDHCIECGAPKINIHHVFYGTSRRKLSDKDGYVIPLCLRHHTGSNEAIHFNKDLDHKWKMIAQRHFELSHTRKEFITRYGKSYL